MDWQVALDLILKVTLVLGIGGVLTAAMPRASAASRHAVWAAVCVALLVLPVVRVAVPVLGVSWWPTFGGAAASTSMVGIETSVGPVSGAVVSNADTSQSAGSWMPTPMLALALVWALGVVAGLARLTAGQRALNRLKHASSEETDPHVRQRAEVVAGWMGLRRCAVRRGDDDWMPVVWGLTQPVVVLPGSARRWSSARLDTVLVHELGHIKRGDVWWQHVANLVVTLWWFHPLAWMAARQLRIERERACDDLVLAFGTRATDYATDLVTMVGECGEAAMDATSTLAMARRSQLEGRVMAILNPHANRNGRTGTATMVVGALALALIPLAGLRASTPADPIAPVPTLAAGPVTQQQSVRVGGQIPEPRKIKHVSPVYPELAVQSKVQGIVILEATIGTDGTVTNVGVIRPVALLTEAAEAAVLQWEFTPTELNGVRVPVIMTVTVNFTLDADGNPMAMPAPVPPTDEAQAAFDRELAARGIVGGATLNAPPPTWNPGDPPLRIGGAIREPRKMKHVNPIYPVEAQDARVQGVVILELSLDQDGRVSDARVVRPVPMLDDAALDAVLQWEFEPTMLNGQPVPVIMTVTVNFTLR
jgi:TonB family protein